MASCPMLTASPSPVRAASCGWWTRGRGVYARCRKDELDLRVALLYFDECHLGGSSASNKSYRKIVETLNPTKKVHVSATTNVASEALLGGTQAQAQGRDRAAGDPQSVHQRGDRGGERLPRSSLTTAMTP